MNSCTLVTGLWNINRENLSSFWKRSFDYYLEKFSELLNTDNNLIIFGDKNLKEFVFNKRSHKNTQFIEIDLDWFKNVDYYSLIQNIRNNHQWLYQNEWISNSPQGALELYNPIVMSKMFLLNMATFFDKFQSEYFYWIDGGIRIDNNYFRKQLIDQLSDYTKFFFISFPYQGKEIHGFDFSRIKYLTSNVPDMVSRATFFGGNKKNIYLIYPLYYDLLIGTLKDGFMGTEESLFTILTYTNPELINYYKLDETDNGNIESFFKKFSRSIDQKNNIFNAIPKYLKLPLSIGILSWNSNQTLENTLRSYKENGLLDIVNDITLFFQECSEKDVKIANEYNIPFISFNENIGIGNAFIKLAQISRTDNILLLEHDWQLVENKDITYNRLKEGIKLLNNEYDCVRYRHQKNPGYPLYSKFAYEGNELNHYDQIIDLISPHLIESCHWIDHLDLVFPDKIQKEKNCYITTSRWSAFTNNPCMYKKDFYIKCLHSFKDNSLLLENDISHWWSRQNFKVAWGDGLFSHNDIDKYH